MNYTALADVPCDQDFNTPCPANLQRTLHLHSSQKHETIEVTYGLYKGYIGVIGYILG